VRDTIVARSYAATLLELADRHDGLEVFGAAVELLDRILEEDPRFRLFLETPSIGSGPKKEVLRASFGDRVPTPFLNFLQVVVDKRRQRLLRAIAREYRELMDQRLNRTHAEVSVSRELAAGEVEDLTERLSLLLGKTAIPHIRVRPELLGGIVVRSGNTIYDGSIRRRLDRMRRSLLQADLPTPFNT